MNKPAHAGAHVEMADRGRSRSPEHPGRRAQGRARSPTGSSGGEEDLQRRAEQARRDEWSGGAEKKYITGQLRRMVTLELRKQVQRAEDRRSREKWNRRVQRWDRKRGKDVDIASLTRIGTALLPDFDLEQRVRNLFERRGLPTPVGPLPAVEQASDSDDAATSDLQSEEAQG